MFCRSLCIFILLNFSSYAGNSITGLDAPYRNMCLKAALDPTYFQSFRSLPEYTHALEISDGLPFADYLVQNASARTLNQLDNFEKLDTVGSPITNYYLGLGIFSATTLRYITIGDQISKLFNLPQNATFVEIGAGFGGQCYILSRLFSFSKYYIYDLPEPNALIKKVMRELDQKNVFCLATNTNLTEDHVDLFISNYAFSECDKDTQIDYFHRIIKKASRGYVLYNQTSHFYSINSLTPQEFIELLRSEGIQPKVLEEPVPTFSGNLLIIWDTNQSCNVEI